jgi:hypothetical protein
VKTLLAYTFSKHNGFPPGSTTGEYLKVSAMSASKLPLTCDGRTKSKSQIYIIGITAMKEK